MSSTLSNVGYMNIALQISVNRSCLQCPDSESARIFGPTRSVREICINLKEFSCYYLLFPSALSLVCLIIVIVLLAVPGSPARVFVTRS